MVRNYNEFSIPHALNLLNNFLFPFGMIVNLVLYTSSKGKLRDLTKHILNWEISSMIYSGIVIYFMLSYEFKFNLVYLLVLIWFINLIFSIYGIVKSTYSKQFKYPLTIKFIR